LGKVSPLLTVVDFVREQGHPELSHEMFKRNLFKITDDPFRFSYAYMTFLAADGSVHQLSSGLNTVRKVLKKYVYHELAACADMF
jgi:hypothetical protein